MIDGFLTQQFRRTSRNMLIGAMILLAAAAVTSALSFRYLRNVLADPLRIGDQFLLAKVPADDPKGEEIEVTGWLVAVSNEVQSEVLCLAASFCR